MARRILSQNRGKAVPKCLAKNSRSKVKSNKYQSWFQEGFNIMKFINSGNHTGIFMKICSLSTPLKTAITLAPAGVNTYNIIKGGDLGSIVTLEEVSLNTEVMNIEFTPGSYSRIARASGTSFTVSEKEGDNIKLFSKKNRRTIILNKNCLCTIGSVAGSGRKEIPLLKAGKKVNCKKKRAYSVSPNKMNAVDHPFGGNSAGCGRNKEIKRTASPGMKVGNIAPRRSGIRKTRRPRVLKSRKGK